MQENHKKKWISFQKKELQQNTDKKLDKGVQCNTLKIHIQELISKIDNLIAEKDDMIEYKDYYVHVKILDFIERF